MARKNGAITGTWKSAGGGFKIFGAETIVFHGTDSTTNQNFTATYKGGTLGVGWSPVSASGGKFTFNGPLDQFVGWSAGVSATTGVHVSYSITPSGYSLVMYGGETNVGVTLFGAGYTTLGAPISNQSHVYSTNLADLALSHPSGPEASYFTAKAAGNTVAAAHAAMNISNNVYSYPDAILRAAAGIGTPTSSTNSIDAALSAATPTTSYSPSPATQAKAQAALATGIYPDAILRGAAGRGGGATTSSTSTPNTGNNPGTPNAPGYNGGTSSSGYGGNTLSPTSTPNTGASSGGSSSTPSGHITRSATTRASARAAWSRAFR